MHWRCLRSVGTAALGYLFERFALDRVIDDHLATLMLTLGLYLMMSSGILVVFGPQSPAFSFPGERRDPQRADFICRSRISSFWGFASSVSCRVYG